MLHPSAVSLSRYHRRRAIALVAGLTLLVLSALLAVACGGDDTSPGTDTSPTPSSAAFPVTLKHKYGETTIPRRPVRVVSVGYSEQDVLLALGVKPLGVRDWYGDYPGAIWPWAKEAAGTDLPRIIGAATELDFEAIAGLAPRHAPASMSSARPASRSSPGPDRSRPVYSS